MNSRIVRRGILFGQCYCFLHAADQAFTTHDGAWALMAAVLFGSIGVSLRQLVLYFRRGGT